MYPYSLYWDPDLSFIATWILGSELYCTFNKRNLRIFLLIGKKSFFHLDSCSGSATHDQGFVSGSAWIRLIWVAGSGSAFKLRIRIQEGKNDPRGLGIIKWQFLIKKIKFKFPAINFLNFRSSNPGSGSAIRKKCWIRIRIKSMRIRNPAHDCIWCWNF